MLRLILAIGLLGLTGCVDDTDAGPGGGVDGASAGGGEGAGEGPGGGEGEGEAGGVGGAGGGGVGEGEGEGEGPPAPFGCASAVVINEILYNPLGLETLGLAFVEIKGEVGGDLTGWELRRLQSDGAFAGDAIVLQGAIPASGYYVVGQSASVEGGVTPDHVDANVDGGNTTNAFQLFCEGSLVDAVAYGPWDGASPGEGGPAAGVEEEGSSLSRCPDGVDTQDNGGDLREAPPTAGAANDQCPTPPPVCDDTTPGALAGDLIINEVAIQPVSVGAKDFPEFIEIVNVSGHALDVAHHRVRWGVGGGDFGTDVPLAAGSCLMPNDVLLVWAGPLDDAPDEAGVHVVQHASAHIRNEEGEIQVVTQGGDVIHSFCYGAGAGCGGDPVFASATLDPDLNTGGAPVAHDVAWFSSGKAASPGTCQGGGSFATGCQRLDTDSTCDAAAPTGLVINEIGFAPRDDMDEYIELYNAQDAPVSVEGWTLSDSLEVKVTLGAVSVPARKALLVLDTDPCPSPESIADDLVVVCVGSLELNNAGDIVTLRDDLDRVADVISFAPGESSPPCTRRALQGVAYGRVPDGGATLAPHSLHVSRNTESPGLRMDGTPF